MKLHIQLEPYNGIRFDYIEVEIKDATEINGVYESLANAYGKGKPQTFSEQVIANPINNVVYAKYATGKDIETKDKVKLTDAEYKKVMNSGKRPWDITKEEVNAIQ